MNDSGPFGHDFENGLESGACGVGVDPADREIEAAVRIYVVAQQRSERGRIGVVGRDGAYSMCVRCGELGGLL